MIPSVKGEEGFFVDHWVTRDSKRKILSAKNRWYARLSLFFGQINGHFRNRLIGGTYHIYPYITPIFQAYVREYPHTIWPYMVQYLHFRILVFPLNKVVFCSFKSKNRRIWTVIMIHMLRSFFACKILVVTHGNATTDNKWYSSWGKATNMWTFTKRNGQP